MDDQDGLSVPNCPDCLRPMRPVVGAWWCQQCEVAVRPGTVPAQFSQVPHLPRTWLL